MKTNKKYNKRYHKNCVQKLILLVLVVLPACLLLPGCSRQSAAVPETVTLPAPETPEEIPLIYNGELTVPSYLQGEEAASFSVVEETEDSITYHLTKEQQTETASLLAEQFKDSIDQVLADKEFYPHITGISINQNPTVIDVFFSGTQLNTYETTLRMSLYIAADKLQLYHGIAADEILTTVNYIDKDTGEIFSTGDSGGL